MSKIDPLYDNVVLRFDTGKNEQLTKGGLVLPDARESELVRAEVIAVGPGRVTDYGVSIGTGVKPGNVVLLPPGAAYEVLVDGERYRICRAHDIRAIVSLS